MKQKVDLEWVLKTWSQPTMSTIRSITLNDVMVPPAATTMESSQTHIVIYHENKDVSSNAAPSDSLNEIKRQIERLIAEVERLNHKVSQLESGMKTTPFFKPEVAPTPCGLDVWRMSDQADDESIESLESVEDTNNMFKVLINKLPPASASASSEAKASAEAKASSEAKAEA